MSHAWLSFCPLPLVWLHKTCECCIYGQFITKCNMVHTSRSLVCLQARLSKSSKEDLESDREEKLDFLRLKTAGLTLEASQSAQNSPYPSPRLPASYVPRNKTAEPSYMDRKLQKMQVMSLCFAFTCNLHWLIMRISSFVHFFSFTIEVSHCASDLTWGVAPCPAWIWP